MSKGQKRAYADRAAPGQYRLELTVTVITEYGNEAYSTLRSAGEYIEREIPNVESVSWSIEETEG